MHVRAVRRLSCCLALVALPAFAGPLVLEESARIVSPDPQFTLNGQVAVDGDFIIATASRYNLELNQNQRTAFLFQRNGSGSWTFVRTLFNDVEGLMVPRPVSVAMGEGIAAINHTTEFGSPVVLSVFQRNGSGYVQVPAIGAPDATDLEIQGGTILASDGACSWDAQTFRRNAGGTWVRVGGGAGVFRGCDDEFRGGDVALSGNRFIIANEYTDDPEYPPHVRIYTGLQGTPVDQMIFNPDGPTVPFAAHVGLENEIAVVSGSATSGEYVLHRDSSGSWSFESNLRPADAFAAGSARYLELEEGRLLRSRAQDDGAVGVFRRVSAGNWEYLAKLVPSTGQLSGESVDSSGNRVVAQGTGAVYVFDLPDDFSQPLPLQDDFQLGFAPAWSPQAGGSFSVVAPDTFSLVYRQQSLAGNATSVLNDGPYVNQSIQADVKPLEFQGADRWLGLAVRYVDANNYYYVTMRSSNVLQLRRIVNGAFVTLASAPLTVTPGRTYNLRLEAIGTTLRVYVDGTQVLRARDQTHVQGRAAILMYRTRADYDNVIATPNPLTLLLKDDFESGNASGWTPHGIGQWNVVTEGSSRVYQQSSIADGARSVTGVDITAHQIIQARVKATAFGAGSGRWFGLMARYQDDGNYYYVTLRNDNTVSLRKLVNGAISVLDSAPLTVTANSWYALRFEVIGDALRAYINGRMLLEARDMSFAEGAYGVAMYKAATRIDDFKVVQP